jgi:hypothetical protein
MSTISITLPWPSCLWSVESGEPVALKALSASIKSIQTASPQLHTLKLKFEYFGGKPFDMRKAQQDPNSVFAVINKLRLPCLRIFSIEIRQSELDDPLPFHPFLLAHPLLQDVSVDLQGKSLPDTALSNLQSFRGSPVDCVTICNGRRSIKSLTLLLFEPKFNLSIRGEKKQKSAGIWGDQYVWDEDTVLRRLAATPTLRRLHLTTGTSHSDGDPQFEEQGMHADYIKRIAKSCPNLTHLELHVWGGVVSVARLRLISCMADNSNMYSRSSFVAMQSFADLVISSGSSCICGKMSRMTTR